MFGSTVLEVAIGMAFVFLLFSLLVSGISEFISAFFQLRANNLQRAIEHMLDDGVGGRNSGKQDLAKQLLELPLVKQMGSPPFWIFEQYKPSYIPPAVFSEALLQVLGAVNQDQQGKESAPAQLGVPLVRSSIQLQKLTESISQQATVGDAKSAIGSFLDRAESSNALPESMKSELGSIEHDARVTSQEQIVARLRSAIQSLDTERILGAIEKQPEGDLKDNLSTLVNGAASRLANTRDAIEDWFNGTMDFASGWYKKKITTINLVLAAFVAILLNVDAVDIANKLANDPTLRQAMVAQAEAYKPQPSADPADDVMQVQAAPNARAAAGIQEDGGDGVQLDEEYGTSVGDKPNPPSTASPSNEGTNKTIDAARQSMELVSEKIGGLRLPIGWTKTDLDDLLGLTDKSKSAPANAKGKAARVPDATKLFLLRCNKVLGWLVTILAISLGAPFWFGLLDQLIRIYRRIPTGDEGENS